jgi:hypothetical protein
MFLPARESPQGSKNLAKRLSQRTIFTWRRIRCHQPWSRRKRAHRTQAFTFAQLLRPEKRGFFQLLLKCLAALL